MSNINLGKIQNKNPSTILAAIKAKNPNVDIDEITVDSNSINNRQATIIVKAESSKYITSSSVTVNYALLNLQPDKIKRILFQKETNWGSSGLDFSAKNKITQLDNVEILLPSE